MSLFCTFYASDIDNDDDNEHSTLRITSPCSLCSHDTRGDYTTLAKHYMDVHYTFVYTAAMHPSPTPLYLSAFDTNVDLGFAATADLYETYTQLAQWLWYFDHVRPRAFHFDDFIINPENVGGAVLTVRDVLDAARSLVHSDDTRQFVAWRRNIRRYLSI